MKHILHLTLILSLLSYTSLVHAAQRVSQEEINAAVERKLKQYGVLKEQYTNNMNNVLNGTGVQRKVGAPSKEDILGEDRNLNGVRDNIEKRIKLRYRTNRPMENISMRYAQIWTDLLKRQKSERQIISARQEMMMLSACAARTEDPQADISRALTMPDLDAWLNDTPERQQAFINKTLIRMPLQQPSEEKLRVFCGRYK